MKQPTKAEFKALLMSEIENWKARSEELQGPLMEQAIARAEECRWLLSVFEGKEAIPDGTEKT